jgi:hypothetical protein
VRNFPTCFQTGARRSSSDVILQRIDSGFSGNLQVLWEESSRF